jgi:hypothetical protein
LESNRKLIHSPESAPAVAETAFQEGGRLESSRDPVRRSQIANALIEKVCNEKSASGYQLLRLFLTTAHPAPGRCDH